MKKILKITAMLLIIAAVMFAAGCAEESETGESETPETPGTAGENATENITVENNETEANETVETGQIVTEADNGTSINIINGENFTLQLRENPSTGYSWQLNVSEGLNILSDNYTQDEASEDMVGVGGNHTWLIEALSEGSQQVNGIYKQEWMNTTGTEDNFTLTVEVE